MILHSFNGFTIHLSIHAYHLTLSVKNNYFYIQLQISEVFRHLILCFLGPEFLEVPPFSFPSFSTHAHAPWCHHIIIPDNENPIVEGIMFFFIFGPRWKIKETRFPSTAFHQSPNIKI